MASNETTSLLGHLVKDSITGQQGICSAVIDYYKEKERTYWIEPNKPDNNGRPLSAFTACESRLISIEAPKSSKITGETETEQRQVA